MKSGRDLPRRTVAPPPPAPQANVVGSKRTLWMLSLLALVAIVVAAGLNGRRYVQAVAEVRRALELDRGLDDLLGTLQAAETGLRGYLLTADRSFLEPEAKATRELPKKLDDLGELVGDDPDQRAHLTRLRGLVLERESVARETIAMAEAGNQSGAVEAVRAGRDRATLAAVENEIEAMNALEDSRLLTRAEAAEREGSRLFLWLALGAIVSLGTVSLGLLSVHRDTERLREATLRLRESEERFRLLAENASDLVSIHEADDRTIYASPSALPLLGYEPAELVELAPSALIHPDERETLAAYRKAVFDQGRATEPLVHRLCTKSGEERWFETMIDPVLSEDGTIVRYATVSRDVTERRRAEEQLAAQARELRELSLHDPLTGLHNRRGLAEIADKQLAFAARSGRGAAIVFVDLNGMKTINDQHGHEEGDRALVDVAKLLTDNCRGSDVVARLGGDEFVVFALEVTPETIAAFVERLGEAIRAFNATHSRPYDLSVSVGTALAPATEKVKLGDLLSEADAKMYEEKRRRKLARA